MTPQFTEPVRRVLEEMRATAHRSITKNTYILATDWANTLEQALEAMQAMEKDAEKYRAINTPEIHDFMAAVEREALHQRERWGSAHDVGKSDADWFWLIGYLAGKALNKPEKQLHHIITTAAACLNWHAHKLGTHKGMRPGIEPPAAIDRAMEKEHE